MTNPKWSRGPIEVNHPHEQYLRPALAHVFRIPRPRTWGRISVRGGALRWDVDADGHVWFVASGEWRAIEEALHRHASTLGWVDSGGLCFVRRDANIFVTHETGVCPLAVRPS